MAFFRRAWSVLWSSLAWPTWTTCIDPGTGRILYHTRRNPVTGGTDLIDYRTPKP